MTIHTVAWTGTTRSPTCTEDVPDRFSLKVASPLTPPNPTSVTTASRSRNPPIHRRRVSPPTATAAGVPEGAVRVAISRPTRPRPAPSPRRP